MVDWPNLMQAYDELEMENAQGMPKAKSIIIIKSIVSSIYLVTTTCPTRCHFLPFVLKKVQCRKDKVLVV